MPSIAPNADINPTSFSNPVRTQVKIIWSIAAICLTGLVVSLAIESEPATALFATFGGLAAFTALVGTCWSYTVDRRLDEFRAGDYHTCWAYTAEDAARFAASERARVRSEKFPVATIVFSCIGVILGLMGYGGGLPAIGSGLSAFLISFIPVCGLGAICDLVTNGFAKRRVRRLRKGLPPTYIGNEGLYVDGGFEPWNSYYQSLTGVRLKAGEAGQSSVIELDFYTHAGRHSSTRTRRVPVPLGCEQEAESIAAALVDAPTKTAKAPETAETTSSPRELEERLADWDYDPRELQTFARREFWSDVRAYLLMNVVLLFISLLFGALPGVPLWLFTGNVMLLVACEVLVVGLFQLGWLVMFLIAGLPDAFKQYRKFTESDGRARFTREGLLFGDEFWSWTGTGRKETTIEILDGSSDVISFAYRTLAGDQTLVRLPVPAGRESEARDLQEQLKSFLC